MEVTRDEAQQVCESSIHGGFASIHDQQASDLLGDQMDCFIGLLWDPNSDKNWTWSDGTELDFVNWGDPYDSTYEGVVFMDENGLWRNRSVAFFRVHFF